MAKKHGAKEQKRIAKQKAKRAEKRLSLMRRTSNDPILRLQRADKWPVVRALAGAEIWETGIGDLAIARQESEGQLVFGFYLVDVFCLGVKNAMWRAGTPGDFEELIRPHRAEPDDAPDSSRLPGQDRQGSGRVRSILWLRTARGLPPCLDAARGDRSRDVPARIHIRPRRQAFVHPGTPRVARGGHGHRRPSPVGGRTLYPGISWSRLGGAGRHRGWF